LVRLVRREFGAACRLRDVRVALRRRDYTVVLAGLSDPPLDVAIKLAGPEAPIACPFDRTAAILRLVRERTAVPVPTVLAADTSYRDCPWRYLITTALPGVRWHDARQYWTPDDQADLWGQLGRAAAALHTLHFPGYGEIGPDGRVLDGATYPVALAERAWRQIGEPRHAALFLAVLDARAEAFAQASRPCLVHDDLNPNNLLVARDEGSGCWHLTGILDFDSAWAGAAESDLARLAFWDGMAGIAFWSGYGVTRSPTPREAERRLVLQLLWCLEYAQPTPRHHEDTARVCAVLGLPPIAFD